MNASELLAALAALPGAHEVPVTANGVAESLRLGRLEIARARGADERVLRRAWRGRVGGGADPLLLLADAPDDPGTIVALGPFGADGPLRQIAADALLGTLRRVAELPALRGVRTLAEELEHLDRAGIAGLTVRGLGTEHLYRTRLRTTPRWAELEELAGDADGEWRKLVEGLGYSVEQLRPRGYLLRYEGRPVAVVDPVRDVAELSRVDDEGRPLEGLLLAQCLAQGAPYGILAAGSRLRLFEASPESGSAVARYLELDAAALDEADRPLLGLLAPPYLAGGGFQEVLADARAFGVGIRKRLDQAIRQGVLPSLGVELGRWAAAEGWDLTSDERRRELESAALTFVFRALFLLYAESAGHLPIAKESYRPHSLTQIVADAHEHRERLDPRSTTLWDRSHVLVRALRTGDDARGLPPYNGALFSADGLEGAAVLDRATVHDSALGPALSGLGIDPETGLGYDFSGLEIGHLGHIYEGLLSLRLSLADRDYRYDAGSDRYVAAGEGDADVHAGELLWLTDEGGRKGGGVYYTPEPLVRHLVRRGVLPAFERHLAEVEALLRDDPARATQRLFAFRVLDPACGSAHFLVAVVDELADRIARFLAEHPLPGVRRDLDGLRAGAGGTYGVGIEDAQLLRRLVLRRCVYGVDASPMGAEIAKISLWLASFVPGLSLAYLDHNVRVGNSLIGVASAEQLLDANGMTTIPAMLVDDAVQRAAASAGALFELMDRNPDEVEQSAGADRAARREVENARALLDLWIAEPLGLTGARDDVWAAAEAIGEGRYPATVVPAQELAARYLAFHWPLEFPEVFAEKRPGFDAVVGNPPWEEVTVEELAFYARYQPGLRALAEAERDRAVARLRAERPELEELLAREREAVAVLKGFFYSSDGYERGDGDPDLYKYFCQRYRALLAEGGSLAVVLPRSAFSAKGSADFRRWLLGRTTVRRLDFLLNSGRWAFDAEPRYTVALAISERTPPGEEHTLEVAGVADSAARFAEQSLAPGLLLSPESLGPLLEVPLLPNQAAADLLAKLRIGQPFPYGTGRWRCFPIRELDETDDKKLWSGALDGLPLWKGESFDQYDPHGHEARVCPLTDTVRARATRRTAGGESILAPEIPADQRLEAHVAEALRTRIGFRRVTNRTNSRTVIAAALPPNTLLVNSVRYLVFVSGSDLDRSACLGLMNSLSFDWQARRFVETDLAYFILEGLRLPSLTDEQYETIARAAARLSCVDERFADFAEATGVEYGPLEPGERESLRVEIDAQVAAAWQLDLDDLGIALSDFTLDAVPEEYRERLRARLAELAG